GSTRTNTRLVSVIRSLFLSTVNKFKKMIMAHYRFLKIRYLVVLLVLMIPLSCSKDFPTNVESSDKVVLESIKIVNAGPDGNAVIEGTVNENKKTVTFPRIDPETDFSSIKFEAQLSTGAE